MMQLFESNCVFFEMHDKIMIHLKLFFFLKKYESFDKDF